jgi:putative Holliday junction resolvase
MELKGRVMAIDLGEKRIGLAISDPLRLVAQGHSVIKRKSRREDFARYQQVIAEQDITLVVMGLPVPLSGIEGDKAAWVRDYSADLQTHLTVPVILWDEALSTKRAEASLRAQGRKLKKIKERVDAVAAAFILQDYLEANEIT